MEITKAVRAAHVVLVCLSRRSEKRGYVQKEIVRALDVADEQPEGGIFLIPVRLEECDVPERLKRWQWVDLYKEDGYTKLEVALQVAGTDMSRASEGRPGGHSPRWTDKKEDGSNRARAERSTMRVRVTASPDNHAPFEIDAVAVEDDTLMVLSAGPNLEIPRDSNEQAIAKIQATRPREPGSVIVRPGQPLRLLAIVHDLSKEPSWTEQWIREALINVLREADERKLKAIGIPPLGTKHGSLEHEQFIELLNDALTSFAPRFVKKVWLIVPEGFSGAAVRSLRR